MTKEETGDITLFSREAQANAVYEKIKHRAVCIAGCGNVGTVVATILAESGIQVIDLIDFDDFSYVDNRQLYSTDETMGKNKAIATALGISKRTDCYVKPFNGKAQDFFDSGTIDLEDTDLFLCVDGVKARKEIYDSAISTFGDSIGRIIDVGVEENTIQVTVYDKKTPHDLYFDSGTAACVTIPLSSFKAFMAATLMVDAYFSLFEELEEDEHPLVPPDHALQIYTNTMEKFLRKI